MLDKALKKDAGESEIIVRIDPDLKDLIPGYLHNRAVDIKTMTECFGRQDFESIRGLAHKIMGTGGGYGFDEITAIAGRLEQSARTKCHDDVYKGIQELAEFLHRVRVVYE